MAPLVYREVKELQGAFKPLLPDTLQISFNDLHHWMLLIRYSLTVI